MRVSALFETPRDVPGRLVPMLAAAGLLALALPVFLVANLPLGGWLLATTLWAAGEALAILLTRLGVGADKLALSGVVGIGMTVRTLAIGVVLIAVAASNARVGLAAAVLYAFAYTIELAVSLVTYFGQEAR